MGKTYDLNELVEQVTEENKHGEINWDTPKNENEQVNKILEYVTKEEERYYDLSFKCIEENNMTGNMVCTVQASVFQRVRYYIEIMLEGNK